MASPTRWTWVWVNSGSWWWTGRPVVLRFMGLQSRTRLSDWTELKISPGSGVLGRSKIHNRYDSWAWELYHLMEGFALLRATLWKSTWGWMAGQLSDGINLGRLHGGSELLRSWKTQRYIVITNSGSQFRCLSSVQFISVPQSCPALCDPMNHSTPGLPVHHQLPEFAQTHVHRVSDAIQPSHPLSSPSPPAPNPSQHQGLFQWVNSSHEVAKVLEFQL